MTGGRGARGSRARRSPSLSPTRSPTRRGIRGALQLLCAGLAGSLCLAEPLQAEERPDAPLYRWTDANGIVRYTPDRTRIPGSAIDTIQAVVPEAPAPAPSNANASANGGPGAAPGALPALMGSRMPVEDPRDAAEAPPMESEARNRRIEELRAAIDRDEAELKELLREEPAEDGSDPAEARIRTIANRLPSMKGELAALERQRDEERADPPGSAEP